MTTEIEERNNLHLKRKCLSFKEVINKSDKFSKNTPFDVGLPTLLLTDVQIK